MNIAPSEAQQRLNLAASAYLDVIRTELVGHYGDRWGNFPESVQQAAVISSAIQTLLIPQVHGIAILDAGLVFSNVGTALGVHTAHLPDATFHDLMSALAIGAGTGRAHRVAEVMHFPTEGNA